MFTHFISKGDLKLRRVINEKIYLRRGWELKLNVISHIIIDKTKKNVKKAAENVTPRKKEEKQAAQQRKWKLSTTKLLNPEFDTAPPELSWWRKTLTHFKWMETHDKHNSTSRCITSCWKIPKLTTRMIEIKYRNRSHGIINIGQQRTACQHTKAWKHKCTQRK